MPVPVLTLSEYSIINISILVNSSATFTVKCFTGHILQIFSLGQNN